MARHVFFGQASDVLWDLQGNALPGQEDGVTVRPVTCWTSKTGGTQLTDLRNEADTAALASGVVVADANGRLPRILGPDGRSDMWVDTGVAPRLLAVTTDLPGRVGTLEAGGGGTITGHPPATATVYSSTFRGARPATDSPNYTWTCDGTGDQTEINAAITAVNADGGGRVLLLGANFYITDSIALRTNVELDCAMAIIEATADFQAGMVTLFDTTAHRTSLVNFNLDGNGNEVHGLDYISGNLGVPGQAAFNGAPSSNPDPDHTVRNGYIFSVGSTTFAGHGMRIYGNNNRAGKFSDIRILGATGCGVWIDLAVDSHWTNIEVGSSGDDLPAYSTTETAPVGHGFFIRHGENNMFTACKAWYSRGSGFYVKANRCGFVNCQAQDNHSYGFEAAWGKVSFVGCHADSNGQAEGTNSRGRAGFWLGGENTLVSGCMSYDRGGQNWAQQHGFQFTSGLVDSYVSGTTYDNAVASVTGTAHATSTINIVAGES